MEDLNDTQEYEFAVGNVITVPVNFTVNEKDKPAKDFKFDLTCDRLTQTEINANTDPYPLLMKRLIKGWDGQTLVLKKGTKEPADFSPGALAHMFTFANVDRVIFTAYIVAVGAQAKN